MNGFGGAERTLINLANKIEENGNDEVYLISLIKSDFQYKINNGIKIINLNANNIIQRYYKLKKILLKENIDIAINFWVQPTIFVAKYAKKHNIKIIYSERGDPSDSEYTGVLKYLRNKAFKNVDRFVFQTEKAKEYFENDIQNKSVVIHNSVSINNVETIKIVEREKRIVTVGRLHIQKNQIQLLKVFKEISKIYPDYVLEIYGKGELEEELKKYCQENYIEDKVKFVGTTQNLFEKIKSAKMFVLTSKYEGMPNALLEAMALGIPCISSNYSPTDSVFEFINDNENGLIYDLEKKEDLKKKIIKIIEDEKLAQKLSNNAQKITTQNSEEKIYSKWLSLIENMK